MANVSVVIDNLADNAIVSAQDWVLNAPPDTILTPHVGERWKSQSGSSSYILFDLGSLQSIDTIGIFGLSKPDGDLPLQNASLGSAAVTRVRLSTVDSSGADGDAYDAQATGEVFEGQLVRVLSDPVDARYVRIDASDADAAAILCGGACIGLRTEFEINPAYGLARGVVDRSTAKKARGGQTFVRQDNYFRTIDMNFQWVNSGQRWTLLDQIDALKGTHDNVMVVVDWEDDWPARETFFGLCADISPVVQPYPDIVSKTFKIEGRL